jgi:deoxyadenosine/deoxycytidine kinase
MSERVYLFSAVGIIGTGKSTALKRLQESQLLNIALGIDQVELVFVQEPVELWTSQGWLQDYYANPTKEGLAFQIIVFDTHCEVVEAAITARKDATKPLVIITERCMFSQHLFWSMQVQSKDRMANEAYMRMWRRRHLYVPEAVGIMHFTPASVEKAQERVATRSNCKSNVDLSNINGLTLAYQQELYQKHLTYFPAGTAYPPECRSPTTGIPCLVISTDIPYHKDDEALALLSQTMANFMKPVLKIK